MATVIIVDDSGTTRQMLRLIMEEAGHTVVASCANGHEGITKAQELSPDLVLVDMLMPIVDGIEVATRLHAMPHPPKIIMLSSVSAVEKIREAKNAGITAYILKPFEVAKVLSVVERCLAEGSIQRPNT